MALPRRRLEVFLVLQVKESTEALQELQGLQGFTIVSGPRPDVGFVELTLQRYGSRSAEELGDDMPAVATAVLAELAQEAPTVAANLEQMRLEVM